MVIFQQEVVDYVRPKNVPQRRVNMEALPRQRTTSALAEKEEDFECEVIQQNNQQQAPIISQDKPPARNTHQQTRSIT